MMRIISWSVIFTHLGLIAVLLYMPKNTLRKPNKHLIVHHQKPSTTTKMTHPTTRQSLPKSTHNPPKKTITQPKQTTPKPVTKKKDPVNTEKKKTAPAPPPQKKSVPKKEAVNDAWVNPIPRTSSPSQEHPFEEKGKKGYSKEKLLEVPKAPALLYVDQTSESGFLDGEPSTDYAELLSAFLHETLQLPEYGTVKIRLSLRSDGSVASVQILEAESKKNREHLEKRLPELHFPQPPFASNKNEQIFTITFCNEL